MQSFAAELAAAAGKDQKEFLLDLIGPPRIVPVQSQVKDFWDYGENPELYPVDTSRLRGVLELVAEKAGWGRQVPKGHGLGLAAHRSFVSYTAAVIEVAIDDKGNISIPRADIAIDCGPVVNPDRVRAQLEGAVVMGLGVGLMNEISFRNGRVQQSNFDDFQMMRITDAPRETHVYIVPHGYDVRLGGVGEPGVPPVAPALMNAIFAASGKRIRSLPLGQQLTGKA
jgi:isoquinoline 1-oxidoreductase subunit beta